MVMVEGFGNKNICMSTTRLGDTKLFFLKKIREDDSLHYRMKTFKLYSSILKVNLHNLKALWRLESRTPAGKI